MKKRKLIKLLKNLNGITKNEWEAIKPFIDYKLDVNSPFKYGYYDYLTVKHFFLKTVRRKHEK